MPAELVTGPIVTCVRRTDGSGGVGGRLVPRRASRRTRCRAAPAARRGCPPQTMAESATLNTGKTRPSGPKTDRKSTTPPRRKPGSRKIRSIRLPSAPPSTRPRVIAQPVEYSRRAVRTMTTATTTATRLNTIVAALREGEGGPDVAQLGQVERAAEQPDVLTGLDRGDDDQLADQVGEQHPGGQGQQEPGARPAVRRPRWRSAPDRAARTGRAPRSAAAGAAVADDDSRRISPRRGSTARRRCPAAGRRSTDRWPAARAPARRDRPAGPRGSRRSGTSAPGRRPGRRRPRPSPRERSGVQRGQLPAQVQRRPVQRQGGRRVVALRGHGQGRPVRRLRQPGRDAVGGEPERRPVARPRQRHAAPVAAAVGAAGALPRRVLERLLRQVLDLRQPELLPLVEVGGAGQRQGEQRGRPGAAAGRGPGRWATRGRRRRRSPPRCTPARSGSRAASRRGWTAPRWPGRRPAPARRGSRR